MTKLLSLPIRTQLFLIALIAALPAAAIIVYSGVKLRDEARREAVVEVQALADNVAFEQQNMVAAAEQLLTALAHLPDVKERNRQKVRALLAGLHRLNAHYSNIFVVDRTGQAWASAVDAPPFSVADRRYFQNAMASGRLSSGEYVISKVTARPTLNFGYPLRDDGGAIVGAICVGFDLKRYRNLLTPGSHPRGTGYLLLDHAGVVLARGADPQSFTGQAYHDREQFRRMTEGPESGVYVGKAMAGDERFIAYRKVRLAGEEAPYMYVRAGIPVQAVVARANQTLAQGLALFVPFMLLAGYLAWLFGKRSIADRISLLKRASQLLAAGDMQGKVSDLVAGGELGALGQTFDEMAQRLAAREAALVASQRAYREIFDATKDAIFVLDPKNGRIVETNRTMTEMFGRAREEISALTLRDVSSGEPPPTQDQLLKWMRRAFNEGPQRFEWRARHKDGHPFWTEVVLSATGIGAERRILAVVRDITERKEAETERRRLTEQLFHAQKLESIGRLAGGVAHDFNNLLTVILGECHALLLELDRQPALREEVEVVRSAAESAAALTRQLLAFSRKQVLQPRVLDLNTLVIAAERMLRRVIGVDVALEIRLGEELWRVQADPAQVEQVIVNLVVNAREAMPRGGILAVETGNVVLEESYTRRQEEGVRPGPYVMLAVRDTGEGMDAATLGRIFEPFFTTKGGKGTGLGLSTVYGIVRQSGGHLTVESRPGAGSTFTVFLPRQESGAEAASPAPEAELPAEAGGQVILVAEDSEGVRRLARQVLASRGYTVLEARSGEEALAVAGEERGPIHLLVTDVVMPGMGGRRMAERFAALRPGTPVLFMSGYTEDPAVTRAVLHDGVELIQKPFTPFALEQTVRRILGRTRRAAGGTGAPPASG